MEMTSDDGFDVRSLAVTYRDGHRIAAHRHPWAQLVYAKSGVMHIVTDDSVWFVPPTRSVWIPHDVCHEIVIKGEVALRTLYVSPRRVLNVAETIEAGLRVPAFQATREHTGGSARKRRLPLI